MNSIHDPGLNGDSKLSPSRKPVRKTKLDAQAPSTPSRHAQVRTGTPKCAHARPYRGQAWPCRGRVPLQYRCPIRRVAAPRAPPYAPCRERLAPRPCAPCPARVAGLHGRIVSASRPCRRLSYSVAALRARVSRPSAQRQRALRLPVRPACPAA